ncbi:MAG TPA: hypothetical protein VKG63_01695 [Steroidobacteraceae bacterium]|nr:hypothetical protein [Steroidobacteraceae bacterium]
MIPVIFLLVLMLGMMASALADSPGAPANSPSVNSPGSLASAPPAGCLASGDGYLRARVAGAIEAKIDWPNSGTRCEGEARNKPPGVRLSFQRVSGGAPDLLFVFGITGAREGLSLREAGANLTVIVQGTNRIYGTLGDSRCTVDSLTQRALKIPGAYRVEARGFCTQPAHAVRGNGAVLVSTFEFAGLVNFAAGKNDAGTPLVPVTSR